LASASFACCLSFCKARRSEVDVKNRGSKRCTLGKVKVLLGMGRTLDAVEVDSTR
jgi:hypothetical protein